MKNFLRALRCAWPYRRRLGISIGSALLAAVFWSANIAVIYPVLYILQNSKSLQTWVDEKIAQTQKDINGWQEEVDSLNKEQKSLARMAPGKLRDQREREVSV